MTIIIAVLLLNFSTQDIDVVNNCVFINKAHNLQVGILPGINKKKLDCLPFYKKGFFFFTFLQKGIEREIRVPITRYLSSQLHWADPLNGGGLTRYLKKIITFYFPSYKKVIVDVTLYSLMNIVMTDHLVRQMKRIIQ